MHRAILWKKLEKNSVACELCSHYCVIGENKKGICGVRQNQKGKLYSLNYGLILAANIDPIEKKPLFHFLPKTKTYSICSAGCNFRCEFCQNWQESQITKGSHGEIPGFYNTPQEIVKQALKFDCPSISYTYTEPTVFFEFAYRTSFLAHQKGLKNIFVTNGYQTPKTIEKMKGLIDAANIDLKSFSNSFYQERCGVKLEPVLQSIKLMHKARIWIELTTLLIPGLNDSPQELKALTQFIAKIDKNIPWHISRFFPQYRMTNLPATPLETLKRAYEIGKEAGLKNVYLGNI